MNHFKNKAQGLALTTVLGGIVIAVASVYLLAKLANSGYYSNVADTTESATETRIMPSGRLTVGTGASQSADGQQVRTGQQIFEATCQACHGATSAVPGAPKVTHNDDWAPRIAQGEETLFKHAIEGFTGKAGMMPAKGGNASLTDEEVKRTVIYMANQSGANFAEDNKAQAEPAAQSASSASATEKPAADSSQAVSSAKGQETFEASCKACHGATSPIPGAPKVTHNDDWAPRIAQGEETLFKHALEGFTGKAGMMPPKGGNSTLSDDDVKAAVQYMVKQSGG